MTEKKEIGCENCDGEGVVGCEGCCDGCGCNCQEQIDCPDCEGSGMVEEEQ